MKKFFLLSIIVTLILVGVCFAVTLLVTHTLSNNGDSQTSTLLLTAGDEYNYRVVNHGDYSHKVHCKVQCVSSGVTVFSLDLHGGELYDFHVTSSENYYCITTNSSVPSVETVTDWYKWPL